MCFPFVKIKGIQLQSPCQNPQKSIMRGTVLKPGHLPFIEAKNVEKHISGSSEFRLVFALLLQHMQLSIILFFAFQWTNTSQLFKKRLIATLQFTYSDLTFPCKQNRDLKILK